MMTASIHSTISSESLHESGIIWMSAADAYPYGIYDLARNKGFVNVGTDHDTSAFAVASIRGWWRFEGKRLYPDARRLWITADG